MAFVEKQLQELGLSYREAKVYKSALELGRFSITELSIKSAVKRSTCYVILNALIEKGLISLNPQSRDVPYSVEPPIKFIEQIEGKATFAKSLFPTLESLYASAAEKPLMKFYTGQRGARAVMEDVLKCQVKDTYSIGSVEDFMQAIGHDYLEDWVKRRTAAGIRSYAIRMKKTQTKIPVYQDSREYMRDVRYAPPGIHIPYAIVIYGKKVGMISTVQDRLNFVIESQDFHQTIKGLFDALWMVSK